MGYRFLSLEPWLWVAIGFLGQALFMSRMIVQWIVAERRGDAVVPLAFWWLSLAGGLITLAYAIHNRDPVISFAQALGAFVYARNLILIRRGRRAIKPVVHAHRPHLTLARNGQLLSDRTG
jgi:lipid-A-disaccharide synthase-like uncharacterized protein